MRLPYLMFTRPRVAVALALAGVRQFRVLGSSTRNQGPYAWAGDVVERKQGALQQKRRFTQSLQCCVLVVCVWLQPPAATAHDSQLEASSWL
jgi:hypothetical protein